jgi:hypothetical protein
MPASAGFFVPVIRRINMSHYQYFAQRRVARQETVQKWADNERESRKAGDERGAKLDRSSRMHALRALRHVYAVLRAAPSV